MRQIMRFGAAILVCLNWLFKRQLKGEESVATVDKPSIQSMFILSQ